MVMLFAKKLTIFVKNEVTGKDQVYSPYCCNFHERIQQTTSFEDIKTLFSISNNHFLIVHNMKLEQISKFIDFEVLSK